MWDQKVNFWKCLVEKWGVFTEASQEVCHSTGTFSWLEVDKELQDPLSCSLGLWGWHHLLLQPCYCKSPHLPLYLMFGDRQEEVGGNCEWRWCNCFRGKRVEMQNEAEGVWQVSAGLRRHWRSMSSWRQRRMLSWHTAQLIGLYFLKLPSVCCLCLKTFLFFLFFP